MTYLKDIDKMLIKEYEAASYISNKENKEKILKLIMKAREIIKNLKIIDIYIENVGYYIEITIVDDTYNDCLGLVERIPMHQKMSYEIIDIADIN
jgi:hypothetical protein